jgi:hypothetical protein
MSVDSIAPADESVRREIDSLEANLVEEFCPPLAPDDVRRRCAEAFASLDMAQIHSYTVALVEHDVRQTLRRARDGREPTTAT